MCGNKSIAPRERASWKKPDANNKTLSPPFLEGNEKCDKNKLFQEGLKDMKTAFFF